MEITLQSIVTIAILALLGACSPVIKKVFELLKGKLNEIDILKKTTIDDRIVEVLSMTVSNVMEKEQKALVAAAADGKLTDEEKENLKEIAFSQARTFLKDEGIDLFKELSKEALDVLVRNIVDRIKVAKN